MAKKELKRPVGRPPKAAPRIKATPKQVVNFVLRTRKPPPSN